MYMFDNIFCVTSCLTISFFFFEHVVWLSALISKIASLGLEPCAIYFSNSGCSFYVLVFGQVHRWSDGRVVWKERFNIESHAKADSLLYQIHWKVGENHWKVLILRSLFLNSLPPSPRMKHDWGFSEKLPLSILWESGFSWSWRKEIIRNSPKRWPFGWVYK